ncbi:tripartite motif-containing protein 42-like [Mytilus californianus]|uniref:tripartite motif-containing protein 42-like n=1 Tax=Mytilus californianus TaxID=6549 RepID=UPI002245D39C|nr:tripartite motif-containing protein 42-like [Mytilus californianus]
MAESTYTCQAQDVIRCMHCDRAEAEYRCVPCGDRMCQNCRRSHNQDAYFASHEIVLIRESSSLDQKCQHHPSFRIENGCDDCKVPICAECKIKTHRNHKYISNDELFEETKKFILKNVKKMKEKERKVESFLTNTNQDQSKIYDDVRKAMKKQVELCKKNADALLQENLKKLNEMEKTDASQVEEYDKMLKEKLNELKVNIETSEVALEKSTPLDLILFCKYGLQISDTKIKDTFNFTNPSFKEGDVTLTEKMFGTLTPSKVEWKPFNKGRKCQTTTLMQRPKTAPVKQRKKENLEDSSFLRQSLDIATTPRSQKGFKELPGCIAEFDSPYSVISHILLWTRSSLCKW